MTVRMNAQGYLEEGEPVDSDILSSDPHAGVILSSDPHAGLTAPAAEKNHARDFFSDLISGSPLNPMNIWEAVKSPEALGHTAEGLWNEFTPDQAVKEAARGNAKNIITGGDPQGRMASLNKLVTGIIGNIPLIGKGAIKAGEQGMEGDYGKSAATVLNTATQFAIPEVAKAIPGIARASAGPLGRGAQTFGRGAEAMGNAAQAPSLSAIPLTVAMNHPYAAAAEFAIPQIAKYGGKGMQSLGRALEGLDSSGPVIEQGAAQYAPRAAGATGSRTAEASAAAADTLRGTPPVRATGTVRQGGPADMPLETPSPVVSGPEMFHNSGAAYATDATSRPTPGTLRQGGNEPLPDVHQWQSAAGELESPLDAAARQSNRNVRAAADTEQVPASLRALTDDQHYADVQNLGRAMASPVESGAEMFAPDAVAARSGSTSGSLRQGGAADTSLEPPPQVVHGSDMWDADLSQARRTVTSPGTLRQGGTDSIAALDSPFERGADMYAPDAAQGRTAESPGTLRQGGSSDPAPEHRAMGSVLDMLEEPLANISRQQEATPFVASEPPPSLAALDEPMTPATLADDVAALPEHLQPQTPQPRMLERRDHMWGPGTNDVTGSPSQALEFATDAQKGKGAGGNRLLYDPQTPTEYLRQQLRESTNPAEQEFLNRAIRQRGKIDGSRARSPRKSTKAPAAGPEMPASWQALIDNR